MSKFAKLKEKLAKHGATNPGGLARYIGVKKFGEKRMEKAAAQHKPVSKVKK